MIRATGPRSAVGNVSDCIYVSVCRSRGREFDPGLSHTFVEGTPAFPIEIDHEIISTTIHLPSADSRRVGVRYKRKYVHEVLVNCLVKLAQEKRVVW